MDFSLLHSVWLFILSSLSSFVSVHCGVLCTCDCSCTCTRLPVSGSRFFAPEGS